MSLRWRNIWDYDRAPATPEKAVREAWKEFGWNSHFPPCRGCVVPFSIWEHKFSPKTGIILKNEFLLTWRILQPTLFSLNISAVMERLSESLSLVALSKLEFHPPRPLVIPSRGRWSQRWLLTGRRQMPLFLWPGWWCSPRVVGKQKYLESPWFYFCICAFGRYK